MAGNEGRFIFDWNEEARDGVLRIPRRVEVNDETLRDGLQSPSAGDPAVSEKVDLLHRMCDVGIQAVTIGMPGAKDRFVQASLALAGEIAHSRLPISPNWAARTMLEDLRPIVEVSQRTGVLIEACTFIGVSPIRQLAEDLEQVEILRRVEESIRFLVAEGLPVMCVTEDTTRADPALLQILYSCAINAGATRICLADTVGHATPAGVGRLVSFIRERVMAPLGTAVAIDWHGHRDRGLAIANSMAAAEAGVDRIHATALGIGERSGNTEMELLLVNLALEGRYAHGLSKLPAYCRAASRALGVAIPSHAPVAGPDAFRTGSGIHAAAIEKARRNGDAWLAERVYSAIPASLVGREQEIEVSHVSGASNVMSWMSAHQLPAPDGATVGAILARAELLGRVLTRAEILGVLAGTAAEPE